MIKKKKYVCPTLEVVHVEMEQGIAAGSANSLQPDNPLIEDWDDKGSIGENNLEL